MSRRPTLRQLTAFVVTIGLLAGCGGGGSASSPTDTQYPYVAPSIGSVVVYTISEVDNTNNTINLNEQFSYLSAGSGGPFNVLRQDLSAQVVVNGTPYGGFSYLEQRDANGNLTSRALLSGGTPYTCSFAPAEVVIPYPLTAQSTWNTSATANCTTGQVLQYSFTSGSVVGEEAVKVAAGSFHALHVRYTVNIASPSVAYVQHIQLDSWIDMATGVSVRIRQVHTYTGGAPTSGYPVSTAFDLSSYHAGT